MRLVFGNPSQKKQKSQSAFTLIELMIVMAILAITSVLVAPRIAASLKHTQLKTSAGYLASTLRRARTDAIVKREIISVKFKRNSYSFEGKTITLPDNFIFKTFTKPNNETEENTEDFKISFYPTGSSSGGKITLGDEEGSFNYDIQIDLISGRVKVLNKKRDEDAE